MSRDDWWDALYRDTDHDTDRDTTTYDTTRRDTDRDTATDSRTRRDATRKTLRHVGRVLTLHRRPEGPRPLDQLTTPNPEPPPNGDPGHDTTSTTAHDTTPPAEESGPNDVTLDGPADTNRDTATPRHRDTGHDTATGQDDATPRHEITKTPDPENGDTDTSTDEERRNLRNLYQLLGETLDRLNDDPPADAEPPKHRRPAYEPPAPITSPRRALADTFGNMPARYRWPLYHLGAAAAGEALALTPLLDTGLVTYATHGAHVVAEHGWSGWLDTWQWWGPALASLGLYFWSRGWLLIFAWPCAIPIASVAAGALLYTPNR